MKNKIGIISTLFVTVLFGMMSCTKASDQNENIKTVILNLEKEALSHWSNGNPAGYTYNLAENATYFDDIQAHLGLEGRQNIEEYLATLKIPKHTFKLNDTKVKVYGKIATLSLLYTAKTLEGNDGPPWKATVIYNQTEDTWQVVHAHWSLIKDTSDVF